MAITQRAPNQIFLGGPLPALVNDKACSEALTPGMLVELATSAGITRYKKHATAAGPCRAIFKDMPMLNKGLSDATAIGDLVEVYELLPGDLVQVIIASGANITKGDKLESAGNGKARAWTNSTTPFVALTTSGAVTADTYIQAEVL